jgi:hypothetical protein
MYCFVDKGQGIKMTSSKQSIKNILQSRSRRLKLDSEILDPNKKQLGSSSSVDELLISDEGRKKYIIRHIGSQLIKLLFIKTSEKNESVNDIREKKDAISD